MNLGAAVVSLSETSVNDFDASVLEAVSNDSYLETSFEHATVTAPSTFSSYSFTHWNNDSYPLEDYRDPWGRSENPMSFILLEDTIATAHYLPTSLNTDGDNLPDWYEIEYFGDLSHDDASNGDGDSIDLLAEYQSGTHPLYAESSSDGGVFWQQSGLLIVDLASNPTYRLVSIPAGIVDIEETVLPGTVVTTPDLSSNSSFGYWTMDGVRQDDPWGVGYPQFSFIMGDTDREGIAYIFDGDSDSDGVPDAYEQYYFGTLDYDANDDPDSDNRTLLTEYSEGSLPHYANSSSDGGVAWADSELISVNLSNFSRYSITSDPIGIYDENGTVLNGSAITTPTAAFANFAYWSLDGVRQEDPWGVALREFSFVVDGADRSAVAHFIDGVPDAFEMFYYDTLSNDATSDTDGDGQNLLAEYTAGSNPRFATDLALGGVFWADSELLVANLQPYERPQKVLLEGVLTDFFSNDPTVVNGIATTSSSSIAVSDWDGDGDFDLFVAHEDGLRIFQNIGTPTNPDFQEIAPSSSLATLIASIDYPVIAGGDWNHDGLSDLVIGGATGILHLVPSNGDFAGFGTPITLDSGSSNAFPALGDFSGDNIDDLLVLLADGSVQLYINQDAMPPYSTYTDNYLGQTVISGTSLGVGDINQDGLPDVLAADSNGRIWEFINQDGAFLLKSKVWGGSNPNFASGLTLAPVDLEQDGDLDLIAGLANGGVISLRDPRVGRPTGLMATGGANSILLTWNADWQSRIAGYLVYRAEAIAEPFLSLLEDPQPLPNYRDFEVTPGNDYHYNITTLSRYFIAGNSEPRIIESLPSDVASTGTGEVTLSLRHIRGQPAKKVKIPLSIDNSLGLTGQGLSIDIGYDPTVITPREQADGQPSVLTTPLTREVVFADNGATANGVLSIIGTDGEIKPGSGKFFVLEFYVEDALSLGLRTTITINAATLYADSGFAVNVILENSEFEVAEDFILGDLNGDGLVTEADEDLLKALTKKNAPEPTDVELLAGDLNGDGELTALDLVLMKRLLKNLPIE